MIGHIENNSFDCNGIRDSDPEVGLESVGLQVDMLLPVGLRDVGNIFDVVNLKPFLLIVFFRAAKNVGTLRTREAAAASFRPAFNCSLLTWARATTVSILACQPVDWKGVRAPSAIAENHSRCSFSAKSRATARFIYPTHTKIRHGPGSRLPPRDPSSGSSTEANDRGPGCR